MVLLHNTVIYFFLYSFINEWLVLKEANLLCVSFWDDIPFLTLCYLELLFNTVRVRQCDSVNIRFVHSYFGKQCTLFMTLTEHNSSYTACKLTVKKKERKKWISVHFLDQSSFRSVLSAGCNVMTFRAYIFHVCTPPYCDQLICSSSID